MSGACALIRTPLCVMRLGPVLLLHMEHTSESCVLVSLQVTATDSCFWESMWAGMRRAREGHCWKDLDELHHKLQATMVTTRWMKRKQSKLGCRAGLVRRIPLGEICYGQWSLLELLYSTATNSRKLFPCKGNRSGCNYFLWISNLADEWLELLSTQWLHNIV